MKKKIKERILKESELMIQTDKTIREIAKSRRPSGLRKTMS